MPKSRRRQCCQIVRSRALFRVKLLLLEREREREGEYTVPLKKWLKYLPSSTVTVRSWYARGPLVVRLRYDVGGLLIRFEYARVRFVRRPVWFGAVQCVLRRPARVYACAIRGRIYLPFSHVRTCQRLCAIVVFSLHVRTFLRHRQSPYQPGLLTLCTHAQRGLR